MYNKRQVQAYMHQFNVTIAELQRYRHIRAGALIAYGIAQRDDLDIIHVGNIQHVIWICRIEARRVGFAVGMAAWEAGNDNVFGRGMTLAAQLYDYHRVEQRPTPNLAEFDDI